MTVSLSQFEAINELHQSLLRMGDFETCADPRGYIRTSNRMFDACLDAGMSFDEADHEAWATEFVTRCLTSATEVEDEPSRYEVRIHGFHSEIFMDGRMKEIISWDRDGSRARQLVAGWERCA